MKKTRMKKTRKYTRKHICEALRYWKKQLKLMNESASLNEDSLTSWGYKNPFTSKDDTTIWIEVYDVEYLDAGTTTDYAARKFKMEVDFRKNIVKQILDYMDLEYGVLPLSFQFKTLDPVKCPNYFNMKKDIEVNESDDDEAIKDQVEEVMSKASDHFKSGDRDEFDRWYDDAKEWVEDEIRYGDSTFDELVDGAIQTIISKQDDYEEENRDDGPDEPWDYEG